MPSSFRITKMKKPSFLLQTVRRWRSGKGTYSVHRYLEIKKGEKSICFLLTPSAVLETREEEEVRNGGNAVNLEFKG